MAPWILHLLIFLTGVCCTFIIGIFYHKKILCRKMNNLGLPSTGNGNLKRIGILNIELTDKEQSLLQATAKFEALFHYAPVAINSFNKDGTVDLWNKECVRIFGYTKDEISKYEDVMELFYGKDAPKVWKDIKNPKGVFKEYSPKTKNGRKVRMAWANVPLPNEGTAISVGYVIKSYQKLSTRTRKRGPRNGVRT